jgi:hypothetical protein
MRLPGMTILGVSPPPDEQPASGASGDPGGATKPPPAIRRYVSVVAEHVVAVLGEELVGVYTTGSLALGDFRPGRSDIDLMAVVEGAVSADRCLDLAARLDHRRLPCPAAGLEFVLYPRATVAIPTTRAGYLLNLNTGAELPQAASLDPSTLPGFWFVIDRAITLQSGQAVRGPSPRALFRSPPREQLVSVVATAVQAQRSGDIDLLDNVVLNACRALRFAEEGRWHSKREAARRAAASSQAFAPLIRAAIAAHAEGRHAGQHLQRAAVDLFLEYVLEVLSRDFRP